MESIEVVEKLANECNKWNIPLMVEPVLWGNSVPKEKKNDSELIEHASRMALEFGADILKIPYTGVETEFKELVNILKVPVFVLGGPNTNDMEQPLLQLASQKVERRIA